MTVSTLDFPRLSRVAPRDPSLLARSGFVPTAGTVVGHVGVANVYLLVRWDGDACSAEDTVHCLNVVALD